MPGHRNDEGRCCRERVEIRKITTKKSIKYLFYKILKL